MKNKTYTLFFGIFALMLHSCNPTPDIDDAIMLDGNQIFDLSLTQPEKYLVTKYMPNPTAIQKEKPVIIAAHGYSATTFEWDELRDYADSAKTFIVSQVLLGGHGRSYADFKKATWHDWQSSIMDEYIKLSDLGFKNIYLAGSSTGAPLIINMLQSGIFAKHTTPKAIFLIDPIVVSSNKTLTMVGLLGPVLGYTTITLDEGEKGKWYIYRPQESLNQLMDLINLTRKQLEKGIRISGDLTVKVFKSEIDATADPVSAVMIKKGIQYEPSLNRKIDVEMIHSDLHVFTRLRGRANLKPIDYTNQYNAFVSMEKEMLKSATK